MCVLLLPSAPPAFRTDRRRMRWRIPARQISPMRADKSFCKAEIRLAEARCSFNIQIMHIYKQRRRSRRNPARTSGEITKSML